MFQLIMQNLNRSVNSEESSEKILIWPLMIRRSLVVIKNENRFCLMTHGLFLSGRGSPDSCYSTNGIRP